MDVADRTLELLKHSYAEFTDFRREQESMSVRLASLEQHLATVKGDLAQVRRDLGDIRIDVAQIRRRLEMIDA